MKRKRLFLIALLVFIISASTSGAYAYWAGSVSAPATKNDDIIINIGEGGTITTKISSAYFASGAYNRVLVPSGQYANSLPAPAGKTLTDEIDEDYFILWEETAGNAAGTQGTVTIEVTDVTIGGDSTYGYLVNIMTSASGDPLDGSYTEPIKVGQLFALAINITLTEPPTKAIYDQIFGKEIIITLKISITIP